MIPDLLPCWIYLLSSINKLIKHWSRPVTFLLGVGALADLSRSRSDLIVENALLRQQFIILNRQVKRPQLTNSERIRFVFLAKLTKYWHQALHIVQPDTLLRWHRDLFRLYWRRKSKPHRSTPRLSPETIKLIQKMAQENRLWGAERIRGELLKLGIKVSNAPSSGICPRNGKCLIKPGLLFSRITLRRSGLVTSLSSMIFSSDRLISSLLLSCIRAGFSTRQSHSPPQMAGLPSSYAKPPPGVRVPNTCSTKVPMIATVNSAVSSPPWRPAQVSRN